MALSPMDVTRLAAVDTARAARVLDEVRSAALSGQRTPVAPRPVIGQSWERMLRSGVDPDHDFRSGLLSWEEVQRRRESSPLRQVLPVLREGLLSVADVAHHIMVVADEEGRVLWREGSAPVLRKADGLGFEIGADWREEVVGTNGVGTPAVTRRPVQVFAAEHFVRSHAAWTCAGPPITDPRDGRLIGVVDVSGPLETMHPATLAWVDSVAKLAEARLRELHMSSLERLRAVAAPVLSRLSGQALVVDRDGWCAAVTGMPYTSRIALPRPLAAGRRWLPGMGLLTILESMGARIERRNRRNFGAEPVADLFINKTALRGIEVPPALVPLAIDEFPILFIAAAGATGRTVVAGAEELRHKESDRLAMMARALEAVGANVEERPDGLVIEGGALRGGTIDSDGDHRIAMAFAVASLLLAGPFATGQGVEVGGHEL